MTTVLASFPDDPSPRIASSATIPEVPTPGLMRLFHAACRAADRVGTRPVPEGDAFLAALTDALSTPGLTSRDRALPFAHIRADLESLSRSGGGFETIMVAAQTLAACVLRGLVDPATPRAWLSSDHPSVRSSAVACCSKIGEVDPARVDLPGLLDLMARLDAAQDDDDDVTLGLVAQLAGKLRSHPTGVRIIETLAAQGERARVYAAHAIAYDRRQDPPVSYLSALGALAPPPTPAPPPLRRLVWLLLSLQGDEAGPVVAAAGQALGMIVRSWPEAGARIAHLSFASGPPGIENAWPGPPEEDPAPLDLDATIDGALADLGARTRRKWTRDDLTTMTHGRLDRSASGPRRPRGIELALRYPKQSNERAGFRTWAPELLDPEMEAEAAGQEPVVVPGSPRLFLSYRWSEEIELNQIVDHYASTLFQLGYDIVFDRDPRHLDKQLTAADVLLLLPGCTHYVPLVTGELVAFLERPREEPRSPLDLEWELASRLRRRPEPMRWLGIWCSGDTLPAPLTPAAVTDVRERSLSLGPLFPPCRFRLTAIAGDRRRRESGPLRRHQLPEAIAEARATPGCVSVEIHDVTRRSAAWTGSPRRRSARS
jgi:hypothetical protein